MMFLLFFSKATKHGTFQGPPSLEPSIGHQVVVFSHFFFSFSLKAQIWIIGFSIF
jgi:hypothetical protein